MVASIDHLASAAAVSLLRRGANAADAAIAASAVLAVVAQHTCGMGGDVWALVHFADGQPPAALNASGRAGSGADPQRLRDLGLSAMPAAGDIAAVPVPGCVDGWVALHERFGRMPLTVVLEPAIETAERGFALSSEAAGAVADLAGVANAQDYFPAGDGAAPHAGQVIRREAVAAALSDIAERGRAGFYQGDFGGDLISLGEGLFSKPDLERPQADWVEPLGLEAWGQQVFTVPPNSQGYLTLAGARIATGLELPKDLDDPLAAHLLAEAAKQAGFDRPDVLFEGADAKALISEARLASRRAKIGANQVSALERDLPRGAKRRAGGGFARRSGGDTNFLAVVDRDRMGVSLIQSNASGWGAKIFTPTNRISLQNRGIGFSLEPSHPAELGPLRRPPHTLSPALVQTRENKLSAVIGTMGGDNQPQILLQLLARLFAARQSPARAIAASRWCWRRRDASLFETWEDPAELYLAYEDGPDHDGAATARALRQLGHQVVLEPAFGAAFGHAHLIKLEPEGVLAAASDPRAPAAAAVGC